MNAPLLSTTISWISWPSDKENYKKNSGQYSPWLVMITLFLVITQRTVRTDQSTHQWGRGRCSCVLGLERWRKAYSKRPRDKAEDISKVPMREMFGYMRILQQGFRLHKTFWARSSWGDLIMRLYKKYKSDFYWSMWILVKTLWGLASHQVTPRPRTAGELYEAWG